MCTLVIVAALVSITCESRPSAQEAALVLARSPGLSNRTNVYTPSDIERPRVVFVPSSVPPFVVPVPETDRARAIRMGIPGGWMPLEWAILHLGRK
jgi:hypothetical protein